jgi:hypothetical protein
MLSSALMAVLIATAPSHASTSTHAGAETAPLKPACGPDFDHKFVHFVERAPSEKGAPGFRLIAEPSKLQLAPADPSNCVTLLTRLDLGR